MSMVDRSSPILEKLCALYAASAAGRTGVAARDYQIHFTRLLELAGCTKGEAYEVARGDLELARRAGALEIETHRRDKNLWSKVRVGLDREAALFALIGRTAPAKEREAWAQLFEEATPWQIPAAHADQWQTFCAARAAKARTGTGWEPFTRDRRDRARELLELCAALLGWARPCLLRSASAELCGDSKRLGNVRSTVERLLAEITAGAVDNLRALGIEDNPASAQLHGPLKMLLHGQWTDFAHRSGDYSISAADIQHAGALDTDARRCVIVENPTTFHELCRLRTGDLLICSSYPNDATVQLLVKLPERLELFHFGDSDVWGFDVLLNLREKTGRAISPLHMEYRPHAGSPPLDARERRKLAGLLAAPQLADVRPQLERMQQSGAKGDFEQERLRISESRFPYIEIG